MEYGLSFLYAAISYLAFIWCMDAVAARRRTKRAFVGISCVLCLVLFLLLNIEKEVPIFPAWASIFTSIVLLFAAFEILYKSPNAAFGLLMTLLYYVIFYYLCSICVDCSIFENKLCRIADNILSADHGRKYDAYGYFISECPI